MKEKKLSRKLNFNKETISNLNSDEMANQKGGLPLPFTHNTECSYSICDTWDECTLPGQTYSGDHYGDAGCQCPCYH